MSRFKCPAFQWQWQSGSVAVWQRQRKLKSQYSNGSITGRFVGSKKARNSIWHGPAHTITHSQPKAGLQRQEWNINRRQAAGTTLDESQTGTQ